jgi:hypothetical protein
MLHRQVLSKTILEKIDNWGVNVEKYELILDEFIKFSKPNYSIPSVK